MKEVDVRIINGQRYLVFKNKKHAKKWSKKTGINIDDSISLKEGKHKSKKHKKKPSVNNGGYSSSSINGTLSTANSFVTLITNTISLGRMFK